jgi:hypothetical protein
VALVQFDLGLCSPGYGVVAIWGGAAVPAPSTTRPFNCAQYELRAHRKPLIGGVARHAQQLIALGSPLPTGGYARSLNSWGTVSAKAAADSISVDVAIVRISFMAGPHF